jgi:hypothetical protein
MVVFPFEVGLVCPILTCVIAREKNMWQDYQKIGFKSLADGQPLLAKSGQLLLKDAIRELHHCSLALDLRGVCFSRSLCPVGIDTGWHK